ncbi:ras-related protein Rab-33A isoform X2 [Ovis canadensis]|uniref:ras-related protein Rab-33A isoform X2 n=1 Tax=Ovis canadensis TaxID=37174 RepID=UPI0038B5D607
MAQPILGHGNLQPASAAGLASLELDSSLDQYVQIRIFKIIVIGDSNVGKTCLTFRFCGGTFPDKTEATIGVDFREKTVEIEGEKIKLLPGKAGSNPSSTLSREQRHLWAEGGMRDLRPGLWNGSQSTSHILRSLLPRSGVGHSGSGTLPQEHGGALLPQRACCGLCLRRHEDDLLHQPQNVDPRMQWACCAPTSPESACGQQV